MQSHVQIVATFGPASNQPAIMQAMLEGGVDLARINYSHGTHESNEHYIQMVREIAQSIGRRVPIIQDLSGPRVQAGSEHTFDPGASILTPKDIADLESGLAIGVEYIAQSFVGSSDDVQALRREIASRGSAKIIAKIERKEALDNISEIIAAADAVMLARGDLGEAVPRENLPFIEKECIEKAHAAGKPVIVATQMLYSMVENATPTRAEVTDVAYAVLLGSDAVMLSDETARGVHPVEAVSEMRRIIERSQQERAGEIRLL